MWKRLNEKARELGMIHTPNVGLLADLTDPGCHIYTIASDVAIVSRGTDYSCSPDVPRFFLSYYSSIWDGKYYPQNGTGRERITA